MYLKALMPRSHSFTSPADTSCLPYLRKRSPIAPTKMFYYMSFVSAFAHVKQAVLLTAFDEA